MVNTGREKQGMPVSGCKNEVEGDVEVKMWEKFEEIAAEDIFEALLDGDKNKVRKQLISWQGDKEKVLELIEEWEEKQKEIGPERVKDSNEWEFKNVLPDDHFISKYIDLGVGLTDAYPEYHFSMALSLLSFAADRKVKIAVTPQELYTNYWTLMIGYSTVSRKSTAVKIGRTVLEYAKMQQKLLPEDFTPEALIEYLQDRPKTFFLKDEFGEFLSKMDRSYQSGVDALLSRLYDCPSYYERKLRKETFEVEDAYITLTGACVPKQIARHSSVEDLESGFFPRINFVWPERDKERKDRRTPTKEETQKQITLGKWLEGLKEAINRAYHNNDGEPIRMELTEDALEYYNGWCRNVEDYILNTEKGKEFSAFFGRVSDSVLKIAALIELGSNDVKKTISTISSISGVSSISSVSNDLSLGRVLTLLNELTVSRSSIQIAIYYAVKLFLPNAKKIMRYVQAYQDEDQIQRVYELAIKHSDEEGKIKHSDLLRKANMKASDFDQYMKTLYDADKIDVDDSEQSRSYIPLDPESDKALPDVAAPEDIDFEIDLPEELDVSEDEIEDKLNNGGSFTYQKFLSKLEDLDYDGSGAHKDEIKQELEIGEKKLKKATNRALVRGDAHEPEPDRLKRVKN